MTGSDSLVRVAEVNDPMAARVYAAMLDSAGIPVALQGESRGPYAMTVGDWAVTTMWVPESLGEDAAAVLTAAGPDPALTIVPPGLRRAGPMPRSIRMLAWAVAGMLAVSILIAVAGALSR